jgi:hypothetical protein
MSSGTPPAGGVGRVAAESKKKRLSPQEARLCKQAKTSAQKSKNIRNLTGFGKKRNRR